MSTPPNQLPALRKPMTPFSEIWRGMVFGLGVALLMNSSGILQWVKELSPGPIRDLALTGAERWNAWLDGTPIAWVKSKLHAETSSFLSQKHTLFWAGGHAYVFHFQPELKPGSDGSASPSSSTPGPAPASVASPPAPRFLLAGDSMLKTVLGVVLEAELLKRQPEALVTRIEKSGTGLARPEVFDWMGAVREASSANTTYDRTIFVLGTNDAQNFQIGTQVYTFGTPEWAEAYAARIRELTALACATSKSVTWLGAPPMKLPEFNRKLSQINQIAREALAQSPCAQFLGVETPLARSSGGYLETVFEKNKTVTLRSSDGIHLTRKGATRVARWMLDQLEIRKPAVASDDR